MTPDPPLTDPASQGVGDIGSAPAVLDQVFDSGSLYTLRAAVQAHTFAAGMPERRTEDVVIAVHELAANAIQHGAGRGRLRMWDLAGALHFWVDDGAAPALAAPAARNAGPGWPFVKGHGLWLVREVADQMSLFSGPGGTRAAVVFTIPPAG